MNAAKLWKSVNFRIYLKFCQISNTVAHLAELSRFKFVGLLYGYNFCKEKSQMYQVKALFEYFREYKINYKYHEENIELRTLVLSASCSLKSQNFEECLRILDEIRSIFPRFPSLPKLYAELANESYLYIGYFRGIWSRSQLSEAELVISQYKLHPFAVASIKVLDSAWTSAIGHLGLLAKFIMAYQLNLLPAKNYIVIATSISNPCYLSYLSDFNGFSIIQDKNKQYYEYSYLPVQEKLGAWELNSGIFDNYKCMKIIESQWRHSKGQSFLRIKHEHALRGRALLTDMGMPHDSWFVSLHVREGGGFKNNLRIGRNCNIQSYFKAIESITQAGGYVIRMGDAGMTPLPELPGVIDYALSSVRSDWMDVFLWACCRFFMGTVSGPIEIPASFGVPILYSNAIAFGLTSLDRSNSIILPKLWFSRSKSRLLFFSEILSSPAGWSERSIIDDDLILIDNSADELRHATDEMLAYTLGNTIIEPYKNFHQPPHPLQERLDSIRESYGSFGFLPLPSSFLEKHRELIR